MRIKNVRFIIAAITTFSAYAVYVSRVNLSIAIIAMVDDGHHGHETIVESVHPAEAGLPKSNSPIELAASSPTDRPPSATPEKSLYPPGLLANQSSTDNATSNVHREPLTTIFLTSKKAVKTPLISQEGFHWDQTDQGNILGAFFYGYILFQIPGARMAESVGAKWIIMAASAGSAVISLAFPLSTQLNSIYLLMVLRFVMGLCQSAFFPAAYVLFCRWLPERERAVLLPIMFIGSNMGSISTYIMSSYLISSPYGWPSVFYLSGLVCLVCSVLWCIFGSNEPSDNWLITEDELNFIETQVNNQSSESNSLDGVSTSDLKTADCNKVAVGKLNSGSNKFNGRSAAEPLTCCAQQQPLESGQPLKSRSTNQVKPNSTHPEPDWSKLLRSIPVWTLILSMYGNEWSNAVLCYELPTYLNTALSFPIEQNGVINSFFQLSFAVASPIVSSLGANMLDRHLCGMHKIHVRKLFQSLATFGQLACFVSVPICGANRSLIITFMFLAVVFKSCASAGDIMVPGDLSPEYAGTIFAFANSIGNTAGFFVPLLTGIFVENPYVRDQWTSFWLTTAAIMGCSGLIFLIFGETKRQDFEIDNKKDLELTDRQPNRV